MTKAETVALATMTPEQLVEGFVRETKRYQLGKKRESVKALKDKDAYFQEIVRRGGASSIVELMAHADPFLAVSAANQLVNLADFKNRALIVLDRIADGRMGAATDHARINRNIIRYGDPNGDPIEYEKRLAAIRARGNHG